jgi:hypothetical protein
VGLKLSLSPLWSAGPKLIRVVKRQHSAFSR